MAAGELDEEDDIVPMCAIVAELPRFWHKNR